MPSLDDSYMERAVQYWKAGRPLEAGRLIHENMPAETRPEWAVSILRLVLDKSRIDRSHFQRTLDTADNPRQWANGHRCFDVLRNTVLEIDELGKRQSLTNDQMTFLSLLSLAELVAKVTYNASDPPDPFDEDSGWWIAASLKAFVDWWRDERFSEAALSALFWKGDAQTSKGHI